MCRGRPALRCCNSFIRFHFASTRMWLCVCVCVCDGRFQSKIAFFPFYVHVFARFRMCVCVCVLPTLSFAWLSLWLRCFCCCCCSRCCFFVLMFLLLLIFYDWRSFVLLALPCFCLSFSHSICLHCQLHMRWATVTACYSLTSTWRCVRALPCAVIRANMRVCWIVVVVVVGLLYSQFCTVVAAVVVVNVLSIHFFATLPFH